MCPFLLLNFYASAACVACYDCEKDSNIVYTLHLNADCLNMTPSHTQICLYTVVRAIMVILSCKIDE